jgi:putative tryptophan/tyrosine transport system substrate-binding protein
MRRRELIIAVAALALDRPHDTCAQLQASRRLIVMVFGGGPLPGTVDAFRQAMREARLEQDRDFGLIFRSPENDPARRPAVARDVVGLNPAVIISGDTPMTVELARAADTIPIVGVALTDPIGLGLASSLAHPSGNVTGVLAAASAPSKLIELLLEAVPGVVKIGVLYNPTNPGNLMGVNSLKADTVILPITLLLLEVRAPTDIEPAFQLSADAGVGALFVSQDSLFNAERQRIANLALAARLPSIGGFRVHTEAGGLMSYGSNFPQRYLVAGEYAAKILKGAKPGDLPIQLQPKLELVINLKTAKVLGLEIPRSILARADEVIE